MVEILAELLANVGSKLPRIIEEAKSQIDEEASQVLQRMKARTPVSQKDHPHLVDTLTMKRYDASSKKYGYRIDYEGYDENGFPYSEKARVLNKMPSLQNHFIDDAVSILKGMDGRIAERCEKVLQEAFED